MGSKHARSVAYSKDAKEVGGIDGIISEVGVHTDAVAEGCPERPVSVSCKGPGRYNSGAGHCRCSTEIRVEVVVLGGWQSVQPCVCG